MVNRYFENRAKRLGNKAEEVYVYASLVIMITVLIPLIIAQILTSKDLKTLLIVVTFIVLILLKCGLLQQKAYKRIQMRQNRNERGQNKADNGQE